MDDSEGMLHVSKIVKVNVSDPAQRSGNSCEIKAGSMCGVFCFVVVMCVLLLLLLF